jgi:hypothetical protein
VRGCRLPDEDIRATAAATLPADHGPEAMAAGLKAMLNPEALLRAFREGDPAAAGRERHRRYAAPTGPDR